MVESLQDAIARAMYLEGLPDEGEFAWATCSDSLQEGWLAAATYALDAIRAALPDHPEWLSELGLEQVGYASNSDKPVFIYMNGLDGTSPVFRFASARVTQGSLL